MQTVPKSSAEWQRESAERWATIAHERFLRERDEVTKRDREWAEIRANEARLAVRRKELAARRKELVEQRIALNRAGSSAYLSPTLPLVTLFVAGIFAGFLCLFFPGLQ